MFQTYQKNFQTRYLARTWQQALKKKELAKNNYRATGDLKKAKAFVNTIMNYAPHTHFVSHGEHVIFSNDRLLEPLSPVYVFAK